MSGIAPREKIKNCPPKTATRLHNIEAMMSATGMTFESSNGWNARNPTFAVMRTVHFKLKYNVKK